MMDVESLLFSILDPKPRVKSSARIRHCRYVLIGWEAWFMTEAFLPRSDDPLSFKLIVLMLLMHEQPALLKASVPVCWVV
jgi:hypothetical protein